MSQKVYDYPVGRALAVLDAVVKRGVKPDSEDNNKQLCHVCALVAASKLAERFVISAAEAVRLKEPDDPVRYFFGTLRSGTADAGVDLDGLLKLKLRKLEPEPVDNFPIRPKLVRLSDVEPQEVAWLWPDRIALGKLTMIAGDPGLGKSFLSIDLAARVTTGAKWPDGSGHAPQGGVVLLNCEDDLADTVRPRLDAAGAVVESVAAISGVEARDNDGDYERSFDLNRDMSALEQAIDSVTDCRLVVIDPVSAYCGQTDSHRNTEVRGMLAPLCELAAKRGVAIVAITHLRKGEGAAIYRSMGSLAFVAAARAAFAVVRDPENENRRLFLPVKNNIGNDTSGLAFTLTDRRSGGKVPCIVWDADPVEVSADEAMAPPAKKRGPEADDRHEAEDFLRQSLASGPRLARDVQAEAREAHGISNATLKRARKAVKVEAFRPDVPGPWHWRLPGTDDPQQKQPEPLAPLAVFSNESHGFDLPESQGVQVSFLEPFGNRDDLDDVNAMLADAADSEVA